MVSAKSGSPVEVQSRAADPENRLSEGGVRFQEPRGHGAFLLQPRWQVMDSIGSELKMAYTLPHFMGYRFGLFNYATKTAGGFVDFDYFRVSDQITATK